MTGEPLATWLTEAAAAVPSCLSLHVVGGPVRDDLLGRPTDEIVDLDTVVEGDATRLAAALSLRHGGEVAVHPVFGTATWRPPDSPVTVDLVTARTERYAAPGALPTIEPGTLDDDLRRRDFTVNAMAIRLWPEPAGVRIDPLGGAEDLRAGLLRIHHRDSFVDDPTRLLRLARLAVRFGFALHEATQAALEAAVAPAPDGRTALATVSGDRLFAEWRLLCREPDPSAVLRWMADLGLAGPLGLEDADADALARGVVAGRKREWGADPLECLALARSGRDVAATAAAFGLSDGEAKRLARLAGVAPRWAPGALAAADDAELEEALIGSTPVERGVLVAANPATARAVSCYEERVAARPPLLTGRDLRRAGLDEGPELGLALRRIRRAQLRGELTSGAEALALLGLPRPEDG
jgi:tRNA nucleotidyltransferase (CCA-adding enzyme)